MNTSAICNKLRIDLSNEESRAANYIRLLAGSGLTPSQRADYEAGLAEVNEEITATRQQMTLYGCASQPPSQPVTPPTPPPPAPPRLTIVGIEQTQGIQYFYWNNNQGSNYAANNSVPLMANKTTALRFYMDTVATDIPSPTSITGLLTYGQSPLDPWFNPGKQMAPVNGPIAAKPASTVYRANVNDTVNFLIPAADCVGTLMCVVALWDPPYDPNSGYTPAYQQFYLNFETVPELHIHGVLIHYTGLNYFNQPVNAQPAPLDLVNTLDWVVRTYPISGFSLDSCETLPWNAKLAVTQNFGDLFDKIAALRAMSGTNDIYAGLIPPEAGCGGVCGLGGGGTALFFAGDGVDGAHEIGHALGRAHAPCGNPAGPDPNYPTYNSYPSGSIGEDGFDTIALSVFDPIFTFDFMSYCRRPFVWISPYTYLALLSAIRSQFSVSASQSIAGCSSVWNAGEAEFLHLFFRLHRDDSIQITSAFTLRRPPPTSFGGQASAVMAELLTAGEEVVDIYNCEVRDLHTAEDAAFRSYVIVVPISSDAQLIHLVRDSDTLARWPIAADPPHLEIGEVHSEEKDGVRSLRLMWDCDSEDDIIPALEFGIRYSADDGRHWRALDTGLTDTHLTVDLDGLPGGEQCCLQVVASAGFRTKVAETKRFPLPRKPRKAYILAPAPGAEFEQGQPISLVGGGFSPDFGTAANDETVWVSHSSGPIGAGARLIASALPAGYHRITVEVPDGVGGYAEESVSIRVRGHSGI